MAPLRARRLVLLLFISTAIACSGSKTNEGGSADPLAVPESPGVRVETAVLSLSSAKIDVSFPGEVVAIEDVSLAAPLGGYVERMLVEEGSAVKEGQVLAKVDSGTRNAQRDIAQAQADQAEAEFKRAIRLGTGISEAQLLAARTQNKVAAANARLAGLNARRAVIKAPFDGIIAQVFVDAGEVSPPGGPIVRLVRLDSVKLEVSVSDRDIAFFSEGQEVLFRTQANPVGITGKVSRRGVTAGHKSHKFTVDVLLPNGEQKLLPGMLGRVGFERVLGENAIIIPQDWLVTKRDKTGVFVDKDGVAQWRDVVVSSLATDQAIIGEGLSAGEAVIISGQRSVAAGDTLIVARSGQCCTDGRVRY